MKIQSSFLRYVVFATVSMLAPTTCQPSRADTEIADQEFSLVNPTSRAKLWAKVFYPAKGSAEGRFPAVVIVPGGLGFGSSAMRAPDRDVLVRAGFVVGYFDPDGRGQSQGEEDYNGKIHQDGLHAFLKLVADLKFVKKSNIGVVSTSYGLAMAAGALARYPDDPPVKYFIDVEGPSDRFYVTRFDDPFLSRIFPRGTKDEGWWAEREAVRSIKEVRCAYLRIQTERDHIHGQNKQHALDMINAATNVKFGGQGKAPWTRVNGPENQPNRIYTKNSPPVWLAARVGLPPPDQMLRWVQEMSSVTPGAGRVCTSLPLVANLTAKGARR